MKGTVLGALVDELRQDGVTIRGIYERSAGKERALEGLEDRTGWIAPEELGQPSGRELSADLPTMIDITENGVRYRVDIANGQKTGFFLD